MPTAIESNDGFKIYKCGLIWKDYKICNDEKKLCAPKKVKDLKVAEALLADAVAGKIAEKEMVLMKFKPSDVAAPKPKKEEKPKMVEKKEEKPKKE